MLQIHPLKMIAMLWLPRICCSLSLAFALFITLTYAWDELGCRELGGELFSPH